MLLELITVITLFALIKCFYDYINHKLNPHAPYPPGPIPFPFFGNFPELNVVNPHKSFLKWKQKYGDVFTVWLPKPVIVLAGSKALQDALVLKGDHFAGRPTTYLYTLFTKHKEDGDGIILCRGPNWQAQRRLALRALRGFGMGKKDMEVRIMMHTRELSTRISQLIQKYNGAAICDMHYQLAFCFGNIIHDLVMGRQYKYDDAEFIKFKRMLDNTLEGVASVEMLLVDSFPWMRYILPRFNRYVREGFALQEFFKEEINKHEKTLKLENNAECFIDYYLKAMAEGKDGYLNKSSLAINSGDLWTGGLETVVTTLRWAILYMIHYPKIQKNIQDELDEQVGQRPLALADRAITPYFHACIDELQRIVNVLPWGIPHTVDQETMICGTLIPKDSVIMVQLGAVWFDNSVFPDPDSFNPARFLTKSGEYKPHANLNPFGLGKRACPGEGLARMELYLVLGTLLQNFEFRVDPVFGLPSLDRCAGMTAAPQATSYVTVQRFEKLIQ